MSTIPDILSMARCIDDTDLYIQCIGPAQRCAVSVALGYVGDAWVRGVRVAYVRGGGA